MYIQKNSEGYDTLLYKTYFDDKVDENGVRITSGKAIGKMPIGLQSFVSIFQLLLHGSMQIKLEK